MNFSPTNNKLPATVLSIPGDKSISHRSIIIGSLSSGQIQIEGFLCSEDCLNTITVFQELGVKIARNNSSVTIESTGVEGLKEPQKKLNVGNSGTGIRLIAGVLSALPFNTIISGDHSIQKRPMERIIEPLTLMGAKIESQSGVPPLKIFGNQTIQSVNYKMSIASAQVKSAILLAGVTAKVPVKVTEPEYCRDHTERMLQLFGVNCSNDSGVISYDGSELVAPKQLLQIPGDISSALFFICLAILTNQEVTFKNIGLNPSRIGCLKVLLKMGAPIKIIESKDTYEPLGDIIVSKSDQPLKNLDIPEELVPNIIDECPILAVLAIKGIGEFSIRNAEELRVKESDRIDGICRLMKVLGVNVKEFSDGFSIEPGRINVKKIDFDAHFDHRLAMSALIASQAFGIEAEITGSESIATSFPNFFDLL